MLKRIVPVVFAVLTLFGCAAVDHPGVMTERFADELEPGACPPGHVVPREISVVVYLNDEGEVQTLPAEIVVERPGQRVHWTGVDGDIEDIVFEASDCAPAPPAIKGRARQHSTMFPRGYKGSHKYAFKFYPIGKNPPIKVDPDIIIEY